MRIETAAQLQRQVDDWNTRAPIGTSVDFRAHPDAAPLRFRTCSPAKIFGCVAVVKLEGDTGHDNAGGWTIEVCILDLVRIAP